MAKKKMIPCRVCGKMFEPCAYCQAHSDVFRWRNFACSIGCAEKYINEAIAYREAKAKKVTTAKKSIDKPPVKRNASKTNKILTAVVQDEGENAVGKSDEKVIKEN